jgi:hypothetical protein
MSIVALSSISTLVARQLLYPELIIKTITTISTNLISSVHYLSTISKNDIELQKLLITSDITQDILIIKSFIEENKYSEESHTILACINNLNETLSDLELNINSITKKIEEHNKLWFKYFRYYDISNEKEVVPILIEKLRHRFNMLIKISGIMKKN